MIFTQKLLLGTSHPEYATFHFHHVFPDAVDYGFAHMR
jgi:hypothetical protein